MQLKLARQLYELACHCEEGWLTDREKIIVAKIGKPDLEQARRQYQAALLIKEIQRMDYNAQPKKYRKKWVDAYHKFTDMYVQQKTMGMTIDTDALLCEWALSHGIPEDIVIIISHHSRQWINKYVKKNDKLYFGKKVLVKE